MFIHQMTASFGKLKNESLVFKPGLNILQAPNETGKSTWCAFLLSMFYGINSRERDRAGFIADKNRYAPWDGSSMHGRLDCNIYGSNLTLTRTTRRQTAPMADFQAVYTGTANVFPNLNSQNCGEKLLGVSREVYERSAFIRQSSLPITQDAGLERRIAALITSGEEDTSYSESIEALKKQLNRRRHNKTGQIPALEAELHVILQQLEELSRLESQLHLSQEKSEELLSRETVLSAELAACENWELYQKHQDLDKAAALAQQSQQHAAVLRQQMEYARIPENETIGRLRGALVNLESTRKAVERARGERDTAAKSLLHAETAVHESPFSGQTAETAWQSALAVSDTKPWPLSELLPSIFLGLLALLFVIFSFTDFSAAMSNLDTILFGIPCAIAALLLPIYKNRKWKKKTTAFLEKHRLSSASELRELAAAYGELLKTRDAAQAELDKKSAAADTLYNTLSSNEQAILLEVRRFAPSAFDSAAADAALRECAQQRKALLEAETTAKNDQLRYELLIQQLPQNLPAQDAPLSTPSRPRAAVLAELDEVHGSLTSSRSLCDRLIGQLHAIGDRAVLQSSAEHLKLQIRNLEAEYDSLQMAMDALDSANTTLQNRFSPELGRRAAEIFNQLTDGHYRGVVLDRSFHLSTEPCDDSVYRDSHFLSAGTIDQLYLATRLAICDLVLPTEPAVPIILDDALSNFDDARCTAALRWLKEESKRRQILLFTCHSREADFFSNDPEVSIQRLTSRASGV